MFSRLPPEVISNHIFPFLPVNDLLRLRRMSIDVRNLAGDYLRVYGDSKRVVRIDADSEDLTKFLALTYPLHLTRFYLDKSSWDDERMQTFLDRYGDRITHLEIDTLDIPIVSPTTVQFFEGLPNLQELSIEKLLNPTDSNRDGEAEEDAQFVPRNLNLPSTFKQLRHLNVRAYSCRPPLLWKFMDECSTHLERVNYPHFDNFSQFRVPDDVFEWVRRIVDTRHRQNPDKPNLKYLDLERFWAFWEDEFDNENIEMYARSLHRLVTTCSTHNVRLQNVDARLIEAMMQLDTPDRELYGEKISRCVVSIRNLRKSVLHLELQLLEEIDIDRTSVYSMPEGGFQVQRWSNLKKLKLWVDSQYLNDGTESVSLLFGFLFHGIRRENLESLRLDFSVSSPYPEMTSVCASCPNLKKLHISNWPGSNRDIAQLWGNLPLLEDVTFECCEDLGDAAFIGDDVTEAAILKATRLKSLTFKYLEEMPGITDALFVSALRHLPLKALYLEGRPDPSITLAGLESLMSGKFAETIEKFPLKGEIQLEGVTNEQLAELEAKFRSAQM